MPARSVDAIFITDFEQLSVNPPRAQFYLEIQWTDETGEAHQHENTYIWPDAILPGGVEIMPAAVWQNYIEQMILAAVRVNRDVDDWDNYT